MKRNFLKAALFLFIVFLFALVFSSLTFKPEANDLPLPAFYKKGAFHMHSTFSDGRGTVAEIARAARRARLDFVILTDHGRPNLRASAATGWNDGVLLIGASEFSLNEGHLAAAGYRVPGYVFPPEAREAIAEVNRDNGVTFISHPFDRKIPWSDWQVRDFSGIEILSLYQMAKKNLLRGLTLFPLQYVFNPDYALTALLSYPRREMETWDRLNRQGRYFGIYALDSHAKLPLSTRRSLHFPSYGATFRILNVYVKVERGLDADADANRAAAAVIAAMRRGDFFSVIESLAPANGFDCYYLQKDGGRVDMGGDAPAAGGNLMMALPFQFATDIVVKKDGALFTVVRANTRPELSVPIDRGGVYRAEISLASGRFKELPWIMTNPIFIARKAPIRAAPENVVAVFATEGENYFSVEKNGRSGAVLHWDALQFRIGSGPGEAAYQHSFLADGEWRRIAIPFSSFHCLYGQPAVPAPVDIDSFFFLIDGNNAYSGAQGEIFLRRIGLY
ncbi:MAG: hypothetical protein NTW95_02845 [Candidatus Aminicenantes bacterium]|nr:hypothetical protein [Candidatus Aminicenantes bacterium]